MEVNVHGAKTTHSQLMRRVAAGESLVISRRGKPAARLVPCDPLSQPRQGGLHRNVFGVPDDFDAEDPAFNRLFEE